VPAPNARSASEEELDTFVRLKNPLGFLSFLLLADGLVKNPIRPPDPVFVVERSTYECMGDTRFE
jgi:hypothetical protein